MRRDQHDQMTRRVARAWLTARAQTEAYDLLVSSIAEYLVAKGALPPHWKPLQHYIDIELAVYLKRHKAQIPSMFVPVIHAIEAKLQEIGLPQHPMMQEHARPQPSPGPSPGVRSQPSYYD